MECEQVLREEIAERYLRGALSEPEREAFEQHYFECARCFVELDDLRLLRQALTASTAAGETASKDRARWAPWTWAAAAAVAVSLAGGLYWVFVNSNSVPEGPSESQGRVAEQQTAAPEQVPQPSSPTVAEVAPSTHSDVPVPSVPAGAARSAALAALAVVQAPSYTPATLRGTLDEAARRFREAMQLYVEGDYEGAKTGLREAAALDPERPDIAFFLGICELLTDQPAAAAAELRRTTALGESPYLEEASFYLAKTHLRQGDLDAAASQLDQTVRLRGDHEQEARDLLHRLEALTEATP